MWRVLLSQGDWAKVHESLRRHYVGVELKVRMGKKAVCGLGWVALSSFDRRYIHNRLRRPPLTSLSRMGGPLIL
jgi:hypothetical protein